MLNVVWRNTALGDLLEITGYIGERNPVAGIEMEDLLAGSAQKLSEAPYIGRSGKVSGTREFVAHPNYILVYKIEIGAVHIIRVLHTRRQYP
ncbi:type II toxin-antitoxin system RelE/ParE family toxin [Neisseria sp.]|uniref:type II toxin-antitoxin system RelE/ParE family toxin n=1 Tax=Neisseria sp. TaxID=192066 RepID=UPI0026DD4B7A|nr:type II toxin-antitoxin system RelE/ParE family toxin [Neisseria sp.]MDO4907816.1 type II toxin-antitoxin system RelE/ParE family toxin [Neisseria sp.]